MMVKEKPLYIPEPFGLPFELTQAGKYRKKEKAKKIDGMPLKTIQAMLKSPKTPAKLKLAWHKKLRGVV